MYRHNSKVVGREDTELPLSTSLDSSTRPARSEGCRHYKALVDGLDVGDGVRPFSGRCQIGATVSVDRIVSFEA
jgi:hypothetical protein